MRRLFSKMATSSPPLPSSSKSSRKAVFVIGGTGLGKTKLGVQLAMALNGEVVNSDAMQLYKGLPIATAQPTMEERRGIEHHLMGVLGVHDAWTVRDYRDHALQAMESIWERGKVPIVVGGTLYYVQSLIWKSLLDEQPGFEEIYEQQSQDVKRQREGEDDDDATGSNRNNDAETPYEKLKRLDPLRASQLHPNDSRKIARSLEVLDETGKRHGEETSRYQPQQQQDSVAEPEVRLDCRILWLTCNNEHGELEQKLRTRIQAMMANGLPEEAAAFLKEHGGDLEEHRKGVFQAIGFRELSDVIATPGDVAVKEKCVESLVIKHRQYVKSQLKWIKNRILPRTVPVHALDATDPPTWDEKVMQPALDLCSRYLSDASPADIDRDHPLSNLSSAVLRDTKTARQCEVCGGRTLVGEEQWLKHTRGRSHRKNLERRKKIERNEQERLAKLAGKTNATAEGDKDDETRST